MSVLVILTWIRECCYFEDVPVIGGVVETNRFGAEVLLERELFWFNYH